MAISKSLPDRRSLCLFCDFPSFFAPRYMPLFTCKPLHFPHPNLFISFFFYYGGRISADEKRRVFACCCPSARTKANHEEALFLLDTWARCRVAIGSRQKKSNSAMSLFLLCRRAGKGRCPAGRCHEGEWVGILGARGVVEPPYVIGGLCIGGGWIGNLPSILGC